MLSRSLSESICVTPFSGTGNGRVDSGRSRAAMVSVSARVASFTAGCAADASASTARAASSAAAKGRQVSAV